MEKFPDRFYMPKISVIVPAYNSEKTLIACLEAIRNSDYKDYELLVINDGSEDNTLEIAQKYADKVITLQKNQGRVYARWEGVRAASGKILVNIDSDVIIKGNLLAGIARYFIRNKEIGALTGMLSETHPHRNFTSQYKNLYMHYIFNKLPERVSFLYGSMFAVRRGVLKASNLSKIEDTESGQRLASRGIQIAFVREFEVIHLKKYSLLGFFKNDFHVPYMWAQIFLRYKGWEQLGRNRTGFAHAPKEQLISVVLAPIILSLSFLSFVTPELALIPIGLGFTWLVLNYRFIAFLTLERGILFGLVSIPFTFTDHNVMSLGIVSGAAAHFWKKTTTFK